MAGKLEEQSCWLEAIRCILDLFDEFSVLSALLLMIEVIQLGAPPLPFYIDKGYDNLTVMS
jgi:hypothetical protein